MNTRMDRKKLNIGTYILQSYAHSEAHIRDMRDCGINLVICLHREDSEQTGVLDLLHQYGIGAVYSGVVPGWWGGDGEDAGKMESSCPLSAYDEAAKSFRDHPAIYGIDCGDEPSALDFPYYGKVIDRVNALFPKQFAYVNLYPNYASVSENSAEQTVNQLGTRTYAEYVEKYIENVPTDYICYDYYMYSAYDISGAYENLRLVADACLRSGRAMWIVLQVNSKLPEIWMSEDHLRFQAYSAMAFGAETILWACYTAGWWNNQVVDSDGNKTEQYEKLKKVNAELIALGNAYMKYRRTATHFVGFGADHPDLAKVGQKPIATLNTGVFMNVKADDALIVGQMVSREADGSYALMLCAADDPWAKVPKDVTVTFSVGGGRDVILCEGDKRTGLFPDADGNYTVTLRTCGGALVIAS